MKKWCSGVKWFAMSFALMFMLISCGGGGGGNSGPDVSDRWRSENGDMTVIINLKDEQKTIEVDGKIMPVTIKEKVEKQSIKLDVTEEEGTVSTWILQQLWNDNGTDFTLVLIQVGGKRVKLLRDEG